MEGWSVRSSGCGVTVGSGGGKYYTVSNKAIK